MTEQTSFNSAQYCKGFNEGYLLTKHLPNIADQVVKAQGSSERLQGFKAGRTEFIIEQAKGPQQGKEAEKGHVEISKAKDAAKDDPER